MSDNNQKTDALATRPATTIYADGAFAAAATYADQLSKSELVPAAYRGKHANCMIALEMSLRLNVSVLQVMQSLYVVHGQPAWSAQFVTGLVNSSGLFSRLAYSTGTGPRGDWCECSAIEVATGAVLVGPRIDMQLAKDEGWSKNGKWQSMPAQMLAYRAASWWARRHCPEIVMGMYAADEVPERPADWREDARVVGRRASVDDVDVDRASQEGERRPIGASPVDNYLTRGAALRDELERAEDEDVGSIIEALELLRAACGLSDNFEDERITAARARVAQ